MAPPNGPLSFKALVILVLIVAAGALCFRLPRLDLRPMHTDEAVHADKLGILLDTGRYTYNPEDYHGPTLYYFTLPCVWLTGARSYAEIRNEIPLRIVPAFFGTGLILLLLLFQDGLGRRASLCAALLTALSPAMVFYSRYYIQEILLVFFTFAAIVSIWRYTRSRKLGWALLAGACLGAMHATKETCVIAYAAMAGSAGVTILWTRWVGGHQLRVREYVHGWHLAGALKVAAAVSILCLTVLLSNPRATVDSVLTYSNYLDRGATGDSSTSGLQVHSHPWYFYLQMLAWIRYDAGPRWSEALVLALFAVGMVQALRRGTGGEDEANHHIWRFLAFYTILMTAVYSFLSYKTPWCMLSFLHGMILLAGVGAAAIYRALPGRWLRGAAALLFALGLWHLGAQAYRANFVYQADTRNPYVYGHTSSDFLRMVQRIEDIARVSGKDRHIPIRVVTTGWDCWPLPWYMREFDRVLSSETVPPEPDTEIIVASEDLEPELDKRLRGAYQKEYYGQRFGVLMTLYVRADLWEAFMAGRK